MEDEAEKKGFKVEDRRRFSSEGELKPDARPDAERPADKPPPSGESRSAAAAVGGSRGAAPEKGEPEITFANFVIGLSTEALSALGEMPDPTTGGRTRDLRAAQQLIDIIGMLREKTRGNLDRNEEALVDAILFDLRMKYVELAKSSGH